MIRFAWFSKIWLSAALPLFMLAPAPSHAQLFVSYTCDDGTPISAAFFPKEKNVRLQMSGKSFSLPQRLSADGGRYAKGGVSFWVKGQQATLKRRKVKTTICRAQ